MRRGRLLMLLVAAMVVLGVLAPGGQAAAERYVSPVLKLRYGVAWQRQATWGFQDAIGRARTRAEFSERRSVSVAYLRWVGRLWSERRVVARQQAVAFYEEVVNDPIAAIHYVFGARAGEAIDVAACETGHTFSTGAKNGQFLGLFQMGWRERATYSYGAYSTALDQARAAYRYYVAAGGWGPWQCRPGGGLAW